MKKLVLLVLCLSVSFQTDVLGKGAGSGHAASHSFSHSTSHSISHVSSSRGSISRGAKFNSKMTVRSKNFNGASDFKTLTKTSVKKLADRQFPKRTIATSTKARRSAKYTYSRPVIFFNPYFLTSSLLNKDSLYVIDTVNFSGFGNGKSGGAGSSAAFADSLKKFLSQDTLEVSELMPINYLSDYAEVVQNVDELKINKVIRDYRDTTGIEIAVLTIPTLGDEIVNLEEYSEVIFDKWGIGDPTINNGVLIVIVSEDGILRIQPGYGLEGLLPDATCCEIEDSIMVPQLNNQQWEGAISGAVGDIIKRLGNKPVEAMKKDLVDRENEQMKIDIIALVVSLLIIGLIAGFIVLREKFS